MIRIGITGQNGFIGKHLYNNINLYPEEFKLIDFERAFFNNNEILDEFVRNCDVIFHLAALNRHEDAQVIYETNKELTKKLVESLKRTQSKAHILFSSSTQEESVPENNLYGLSKKECREMLSTWANQYGGKFTGLVIPNVFGPFGKPFYNSFIATFCHLLTNKGKPEIHQDNNVALIYVQELVNKMISLVRDKVTDDNLVVKSTATKKVSEILNLLERFKNIYFEQGNIPELSDDFERNLFNTYRSFISHEEFFPVKYTLHSDDRGSFVEIIRLGTGGQVSFSTTVPGVTRGNHFHTRKIERFSVIKGKALVEMRKIGEEDVLSFEIEGEQPGFVDMPVWYTHNIKNIGDDVLYTVFWINEQYNLNDADTYFEEV